MGNVFWGLEMLFFNSDDFSEIQQGFQFYFKRLITFCNPPNENIQSIFEDFHNVDITLKTITENNAVVTAVVAKAIGFGGYDNTISGDE